MDGIIDSDSSHAEWIYNASGRYNVCLTINDGMTDYTDLRYNFIHVYEYGCTNRYSCTFDPNATIDDGSCLYDIGCGCGEDQINCWDDTIVCDINECTVEPDISIAPSMLSLELSAGSSESYEITLFNDGGSNLNWSSNDYFIADSVSIYDIGCNDEIS